MNTTARVTIERRSRVNTWPPKKSVRRVAQEPVDDGADDADENCRDDRHQLSVNDEAGNEVAREPQTKRGHDEIKEPERDDGERQCEDDENRPDDRVDQAQHRTRN